MLRFSESASRRDLQRRNGPHSSSANLLGEFRAIAKISYCTLMVTGTLCWPATVSTTGTLSPGVTPLGTLTFTW
jgi:hypothetical protein